MALPTMKQWVGEPLPPEDAWQDDDLAGVVTKTFQHTYEHGDTLLRMGLWWEHILGEFAKAQAKAG